MRRRVPKKRGDEMLVFGSHAEDFFLLNHLCSHRVGLFSPCINCSERFFSHKLSGNLHHTALSWNLEDSDLKSLMNIDQ